VYLSSGEVEQSGSAAKIGAPFDRSLDTPNRASVLLSPPRLLSDAEDGVTPRVNGILLLYHRPLEASASTIVEHVQAFPQHSRFPVWCVNTEFGFPRSLSGFQFSVVVLHYSLFGIVPYRLDDRFLDYLNSSGSYTVAFFQDEHHHCRTRFAFLDRHAVDCVYTLLEPACWPHVYGKHTEVRALVYTIPGYVSDEFVAKATQFQKPDSERRIDIGYRGRTLLPYMGRGGQEKAGIGLGVLERAGGSGVTLDIEVDEQSRLYGDDWLAFLSDCRATLGTEAGVSVFDVEDVVRLEYERLVAENPAMTFDELSAQLLEPWEDNVYYRTVSPRHFEAAALRVCQILFEGKYSGILQPMTHYIPLKKDYSNWEDVLCLFRDPKVRRELTENAYRDLIASRRYAYERFIDEFDENLVAAGVELEAGPALAAAVTESLARERRRLERLAQLRASLHRDFPGRRFLRPLGRSSRYWYGRWSERRATRPASARADE